VIFHSSLMLRKAMPATRLSLSADHAFLLVVVAPLHLEGADGAADAAQVLVAQALGALLPARLGVAGQAGQERRRGRRS
jgi:hypothetical protein